MATHVVGGDDELSEWRACRALSRTRLDGPSRFRVVADQRGQRQVHSAEVPALDFDGARDTSDVPAPQAAHVYPNPCRLVRNKTDRVVRLTIGGIR